MKKCSFYIALQVFVTMGLQTILESDDHHQVGYIRRPDHSSHHHRLKAEKRDEKEKSTGRKYFFRNLNSELRELAPDSLLSPYRKSMPSTSNGMDLQHDELIQRRGSVYHSSREIRKKEQDCRRKTKPSHSNKDFISFEILNSSSLHYQDEIRSSSHKRSPSSQKKRSSLIPSSKNNDVASLLQTGIVKTDSPDFLDLSFRFLPEKKLDDGSLVLDFSSSKENTSDDFLEIDLSREDLTEASGSVDKEDSVESSTSTCNKQFCSETDGSVFSESRFLPKSFSAKMETFSSLNQTDDASKNRLKYRNGSCKRLVDPIFKSKSQRNSSLSGSEIIDSPTSNLNLLRKSKMFQRSLSNEFSRIPHRSQKTEKYGMSITRDVSELVPLSPIHLSGILKLERRNGSHSFQFFPKGSEDIHSAKVCRTNSPFNWIYTFHKSKNKNCSSGRGSRHIYRQSPSLIGLMQSSCYLCSEIRKDQSLDKSTEMEFVLYDIAQAGRSYAGHEMLSQPAEANQYPELVNAEFSSNTNFTETKNILNKDKSKRLSKLVSCNGDLDDSDSLPWSPTDMLPHMEIAAIVIRFPYNMKADMINSRKQDTICMKEHLGHLSRPISDEAEKTVSDYVYSASMKVITPSGGHGLPCTEDSPTPLLDRWRSGGICDCGGWDMGCPIVVFDDNNCIQGDNGRSNPSLKLFIQVWYFSHSNLFCRVLIYF